ncbi:MAG: hypothetical protein ACI9FN_003011 [Saprospiraceae bacterium]|jgi:hypothetical protein
MNYNRMIGFCKFLIALMGSMILIQCSNDVRSYEDLVVKEMSSGVVVDTLFHGIYFDMPAKDFYKHCWDMNKKGLLADGFGNSTAAFKLTGMKADARFEFYPRFKDDKISAMPAFVHYNAWAPWNTEFSAIQLIEDIQEILVEWYGLKFYPIKAKSIFGKAYVGVKGNLKIVLYHNADNKVEIAYTDLRKGDDVKVVFKQD